MNDPATRRSVAHVIDRRIRYAMRILENEQTPLPETEYVAERVGLSVFHFVRLFGDQVGSSPQDYGRSLMMMHAASRLRYSDEPVEVVARGFGYVKQATFNKAFTRHHGMPPARWRRQAKAELQPASSEGVRLERLPLGRASLGATSDRAHSPAHNGPTSWIVCHHASGTDHAWASPTTTHASRRPSASATVAR